MPKKIIISLVIVIIVFIGIIIMVMPEEREKYKAYRFCLKKAQECGSQMSNTFECHGICKSGTKEDIIDVANNLC